MKYFSVAFVVAFFCATAVSAAPSGLDGLEAFINPFTNLANTLKETWVNVQCIRDVVDEVLHGSDISDKWQETKTELERHRTDYRTCMDIPDDTKQQKCRMDVVQKYLGTISQFARTLFYERRWDLLKEIRIKAAAQCFDHSSFFDLEEATEEEEQVMPTEEEDQVLPTEEEDQVLPTEDEPVVSSEEELVLPIEESVETDLVDQQNVPKIVEQFQCVVDAMGTVSKRLGLDELWAKQQPELQAHLNKWKQCGESRNKVLEILCNLKEGFTTYRLAAEYVRLAVAENPEFTKEFAKESKKCQGNVKQIIAIREKGADKLKCIVDAITAAVKDTDFAKIWEEYKKDLEKMFDRIKACKSETTRWDQIKCARKEAMRIREVIFNFLAKLKKANKDAYNRAKQNIKRCYQ